MSTTAGLFSGTMSMGVCVQIFVTLWTQIASPVDAADVAEAHGLSTRSFQAHCRWSAACQTVSMSHWAQQVHDFSEHLSISWVFHWTSLSKQRGLCDVGDACTVASRAVSQPHALTPCINAPLLYIPCLSVPTPAKRSEPGASIITQRNKTSQLLSVKRATSNNSTF